MCGISGFYNIDDKTLLLDMINRLKNRGPEHTGYALSDFGGIANARLSIIDVEGGNQPIWNEDESIAVVANCEIYNFQQLKKELIEKGHEFSTKTDTEVIVHGYEEWGLDISFKIDGIFAIAIMDLVKKQIVLIRDRLGIKPLYYYQNNDIILFGSEAKSILQYDEVPRILDTYSLKIFLHLSYITGDMSLFKGIKQLLPAHYLVINDEGVRLEKYWSIPPLSNDQTLDMNKLDRLVNNAIRRQLISDRPIGVFLSGGLDSSLVAYYASKNSDEISAFTQSFGEFDESPHARKVAEQLGIDHHIIEHTPEDEIKHSRELITAMEHPTYGLSHTYTLSNFARSKGKVVMLSGLGGDELFSGYVQHQRASKFNFSVPLGPLNEGIAKGFELLNIQRAARAARVFSNKSIVKLKGLKLAIAEGEPNNILSNNGSKIQWQDVFHYDEHKDFRRVVETELIYDQLEGNYLKIADRMSMAASLEMRVPLLDTPLFEYALSLPMSAKINNGVTKYGLRKLANNKLPKSIVNRGTNAISKGGYGFDSLDFWERGVKSHVQDLLDPSRVREYGVFDPSWVKKSLDNVDSSVQIRILWNMAGTHQLMDIFDLRLDFD